MLKSKYSILSKVAKSNVPKALILLFDKSNLSSCVNVAIDLQGTLFNSFPGKPKAKRGSLIPKKADLCTRFISPDEIIRHLKETLSNIRASLRKVTFLKDTSNNATEYGALRKC